MKNLLIIFFCFICYNVVAQVRKPSGIPTQFSTGWFKQGYQMADSGTIIANRDTNWLAKYSGTIVFRPANKQFYYFDSTVLSWFPFGINIDTTSLSYRIDQKLNIIDTTNKWWGLGKRWADTLYRINDSTVGYTINGSSHSFQILGRSPTGGGSGTVTSVALSMPSAFTVTGSPITTSGTFNITGAGTSAQLIRGNGTLVTSDTGIIPNFYLKVRGLLSGSSPITYNTTTGIIGIQNANNSGTKGAATFTSAFADNGSGLIDLPDLVTASSCTNCNVTFDAKGRATAFSTGSGGSGAGVDTIYRTPGIDSIYYTINSIQRAIKDSSGGTISYTDVAYVDSIYGNNTTALLNRADKPFATIDAALDAGASRPSLHIIIGFGSFASPTPSKMRNYLWIQGAGKPGHNGVVIATGYAVFTNTAPTQLKGGTILRGTLQSVDHQFVKYSDLGVDCGPAYVAGGGTEGNCIGIGSLTSTTPFTLMQGIDIENVICLGLSPTSLFHGIVLENCIEPIINNATTIFATHGIVGKNIGGIYTNLHCHDHHTDGIVLKSNSYAYGWRMMLDNFEVSTMFSADCGGVDLFFEDGPAFSGVFVSNGVVAQASYGLNIHGTVDNCNVTDVYCIALSGPGFTSTSDGFVYFINCGVRSAVGDGFNINKSSGITFINGGFSYNCSDDAYDLNSTTDFIQVENVSTSNNSGYGIRAGSNVYVGEWFSNANAAGASTGTLLPRRSAQLARTNTFTNTNTFNSTTILNNVTAPPSTYNVLIHGLTDSTVYQLPASSLGGITSINSQTGSSQTLAANNGLTATTTTNTVTYTLGGTLTGLTQIAGASNTLQLGTSGSHLGGLVAYADQTFLLGSLRYLVDDYSTDADHTVPATVIMVELHDVLSTNRTLTMPNPATAGQGTILSIVTRFSSGVNHFNLASAITDNATGSTFTQLDWGKTYDFYVQSGLAWILIRKY